ncbi:MAG: hypothetical protein LIO55_04080 [Oscillospiraceae bacterium]|nr:hypothetical protein [Oscillospiraceae bacterium]
MKHKKIYQLDHGTYQSQCQQHFAPSLEHLRASGDKQVYKFLFQEDKQMKQNLRLRNAMKRHAVRQWQLADALGMDEGSLCRKLRHELPAGEAERLLRTVFQLARAKEAEQNEQ